MRFAALLVACVALASVSVSAQAPIPYRADGYQIAGPVDAPINMDVFVDTLCPDCAGAWPNIKAVADYYGANVSIAMHAFPLPYHTNGFMTAQAARVVMVNAAEPAAFRKFADFMFGAQAQFWNGATADLSATQIQAKLGAALEQAGFLTAAQFAAGMADDNLNNDARVSWKFGCSKGVLGTPTFFVNGVNVNGDPSWSLSDWRQLLDPLLAPAPAIKHAHKSHPHGGKSLCNKHKQRAHSTRLFGQAACPAGEPVCKYLPGKTECCFPGENCIPNVGCRC